MLSAEMTIKEIEKDSELKTQYLTHFGLPEETYSFLQCEPFHQIGIKGFFFRLFHKAEIVEIDSINPQEKEKNKKEKKSFFKRLFGGKD